MLPQFAQLQLHLCHRAGFQHSERKVVVGNQSSIRVHGVTRLKQFVSKEVNMLIRKILLVALSMSTLSAAAVEWRLLTDKSSKKMYLDYSSIKIENQVRKAWLLLDDVVPNKSGALSTLFLSEFHCEQQKYRVIQFDNYKENMARGPSLRTYRLDEDWTYVQPNTTWGNVLLEVCKPPSQSSAVSNKRLLRDCADEDRFIRLTMKMRQEGTPIDMVLSLVDEFERKTSSPISLEERLHQRRELVQYAYVGNPSAVEESANIWHNVCTKVNQQKQ